VEQEPPRSQSSAGSAEAPVPVSPFVSQPRITRQTNHMQVHSSSRQELQDALVLLNQKSEEIEILKSRNAALEAQIEHLQAENHRSQVENEKLSVEKEVQREALEEAKGTVSELCVHIDWVQDSWNKSMTREKQLQDEAKEVQDALDVKEEEYNLARLEWGQERALLEAQLASLKDQQPPTDWELGKQELEDKLAELSAERDQLDKDKRTAENEVESWKEQYRKEFIRSQELRREAGDAKAETTRIQRENAILASQNKEGIRLVTAKYEAVVEKLKEELAKAGSLYKVLQEKDEQTGDDLRRRAVSATCLKEEVRRLREDLLSDQRAVHSAEHSRGEPSFLVRNPAIKLSMEDKYGCQMPIDGGRECDQTFGTPQVRRSLRWPTAMLNVLSRNCGRTSREATDDRDASE
jgi:DNA repair exonuclease SbcCD ATPase subunit